MATGAQPVWANSEFRLDPNNLPQKMCYATRGSGGEVSITIDQRGAVLKRELDRSGLPLNIALPNRVFRGVAARAIETGPDTALVTLELLHEDEDLCVPLRVGHELADVVRDWKIWAECLKLPMMIIGSDDVARTLEESAESIVMDKSQPRRANALFADRRPRFLARRRLGTLGVRLMVSGDEIISRN